MNYQHSRSGALDSRLKYPQKLKNEPFSYVIKTSSGAGQRLVL